MAELGFDGLGRILEMIEERLGRLGRPISNIVIVVVILAIITYCVNEIVQTAIVPAWHLVGVIRNNSTGLGSVLYEAMLILANVVMWAIAAPLFVFAILKVRKDIKFMKNAAAIIEKRNQKAAEILLILASKTDEAKEKELTAEECKKLISEIKVSLVDFFKEMEADGKTLGSPISLPEQSRPDQGQASTPEKT